MKTKLLSPFLIIFSCATIHAQEFIGFVKKADSTASPIFQAKVEITEGDKPFKSLKTYFDGSFKFLPNKNQTYSIKITYSGYTDTAYTVTSDKEGKVSAQNITVVLKKDGMRLMGVVKSREQDFPIKGATVVLKNVMTRKEDRITTDIDGRYNFKLEYETNYKVWIDKRSPGIFNLYKDTSFYISTIGFNLPLDYKLDISLDKMVVPVTPVRQGYNPAKQPFNKNAESGISIADKEEKSQVVLKNDSSLVSKSERKDEKKTERDGDQELKSVPEINPQALTETNQPTKKPEVTKQKSEAQKEQQDSAAVVTMEKEAKPKKAKAKVEVVVIRDTVRASSITNVPEEAQPLSSLDVVRQKAIAEKKARANDTVQQKIFYLTKPQQDLIQAAEMFAKRKKFVEDSIAKAKELELKKAENLKQIK